MGRNTAYIKCISDFKFRTHKWVRGQKTTKHIRRYTSRTIRHSDVETLYRSYYLLSQVYLGLSYPQTSGGELGVISAYY